jgi:hypothetical protein
VLKLTGIPCCPQLSMGSTNIRASARCAMAKRHQNVWAKRRITWGVYAGSQMQWISFNEISNTLWLFNIAMENGPFIDDFPIKTSIYKGFSMAMLNNQMVILLFYLLQLLIRVLGYPTWHSLVSRSESTQKRSKHFHDKQIEKSMATWMINFKPNPAHINIIYICISYI